MRQLELEKTIQDYIDIVIPAMYHKNYHLLLAKGGPDYPHLAEQSMLGHILNGAFGLFEILKFIESEKICCYGLNHSSIRKALALYSIHDIHKFNDFQKIGNSEFSIPLERLEKEYENLNLVDFAGEVDAHLMRSGNVSKRSTHHGDLLLSNDENGNLLWILVRIADTIASVTSPSDLVFSLENYLKDLAPEFRTKYKLYSHELKDIRGVLTNSIHTAVKNHLCQELGFQDIAYFSTGTLYIGEKKIDVFYRKNLIKKVVFDVLNSLQPSPEIVKSAAKEGLREKQYDFQDYVYTFSTIKNLLQIILETTQNVSKPDAKTIIQDIEDISKRSPQGWLDSFEPRFDVSLDESKDFNQRWFLVRRYLLYVDGIMKGIAPDLERVNWFCDTFKVPSEIKSNLQEDRKLFSSGGSGKYIIVPGYYFLRGIDFDKRLAESLDYATVIQLLHDRTLSAFEKIDTKPGKQAIVDKLGFQPDLVNYIDEQVNLSFSSQIKVNEDGLDVYAFSKKKGHSKVICSICNRQSQYTKPLRTGILGDSGRVFSNRVLPAKKVPNDLRPWCPICHLEFIMRKLIGLALPSGSGADYNSSRRIHLYVLPTFSFTPEYAKFLDRMLRPLREITALPIRDYGESAPGFPRIWLEQSKLDSDWIDRAIDVFNREAERIAQKKGYVGERLLMAKSTLEFKGEDDENNDSIQEKTKLKLQPNYYLIPWEHSVGERDENPPTRTEAWAKATFAATVIFSLTSSRVYVTELPYLPVANPNELKATITLDSPPAIIAKLLGNEQDPKLASRADTVSLYGTESGHKNGLERALDLCAALWMITSCVHRPKSQSKDKQIAERLGDVVVNQLAGAHFYKEYGRLNEDKSPFPVLTKSCEILLEYFGGELMNLVTKIAEKSLEIRLPYRDYGRGKAHNYELVFREVVDAMRSAFRLIPELRQMALTGAKPSPQAITELKQQASGTVLKAMERRQTTKRGDGFINPYRNDLGKLVSELIDLVVDEVFLSRADSSFAEFLKLENSLADGIYYYTDRHINEKREEYKATKQKDKNNPDIAEIV
ncbi:MAG: type I-D CRISPR-associated protein Cas10d/Csc3 [Roseofilum sp. SBFL]|nr:type I-D CRISPR-associated protein Cas10d/Csc3 [Roseofilum sp. SID2]MBP0013791.1 type I-D CRISPR-associated protein Cas10d/Csc3 [Roseofilum sp. SID3]MBP0026243.1 type I-D CRISPR-associated protein Cas10d/Csc3 [Roseofilum sp. SID2]MBP0040583.1 type I-D CRISPR-associated protein Cas10d/Csc3 [Roseofilum sp. SBFL]